MRPSSSTMTSAHTDIDNGRSYVFMSSGLEDELYLDENDGIDSLPVSLKLGEKWSSAPFLSIEHEANESILLCINSFGLTKRLTGAMLDNEALDVSIDGKRFKSQVVKLESNRSYLRISR